MSFAADPRGRRPLGWWYPWVFVGGMAVVVAVNGILMFLAMDTWTGLETEDAYRKGIHYNEALAGARAQAALGWTLTLAFDPETAAGAAAGGEHRGDMTATFRDGDGRAVTGLDIEAQMIRPTHEGFDRRAVLKHRGGGIYGARVALALPGQWTVRIHARRGGDTFQASRRIQVP